MIQRLSTPISVGLVFDHQNRKVIPKWVLWNKRYYPITKIGLHHTERLGRSLYHIFSVATNNLFFRLVLDTETLSWRVEEISDGLPN